MTSERLPDAWGNAALGSAAWFEKHLLLVVSEHEPWRTLFALGLATRLPCVAWALVDPTRIGSLPHVLPRLTSRLKLDYDDAGVVEILKWWGSTHGADTPEEGWGAFVNATPFSGNPCIYMDTDMKSVDREMRLSGSHFPPRSCSYMGSDYMCTTGPKQTDVQEQHQRCVYQLLASDPVAAATFNASPLACLIADGDLYALKEREMKVYAFIWDETRRTLERAFIGETKNVPAFPFVTLSQNMITAETGVTSPGEPVKSLVAKGLVETLPPTEKGDATQYRLVTPPPHRHHDERLEGLNDRCSDTAPAKVSRDEAIHILLELSEDPTSEALAALARAGIGADVALRRGMRYLPKEKNATLKSLLEEGGFADSDLKKCGIFANSKPAFNERHIHQLFIVVGEAPQRGVLVFKVGRSGSCKVARTRFSEDLPFETDTLGNADEFVLCQDAAEVLVMESAGFAAVSYCLNTSTQPKRIGGTRPRPWTGKRVLVSWQRDERTTRGGTNADELAFLRLTGARFGYMSRPLSELLRVMENIPSVLEADFSAMRPKTPPGT